MSGMGKRLKSRREELELTQGQLAHSSGVSQPTIANIEGGRNKGSKHIVSLARALHVHPRWLDTGKGPKEVSQNTEPGPDLRGKVPVISWTTAGTWADIQDPFSPGEAEEWVWTTKTVGPSAFALRVIGDSMEPKIPEGSIVIIDPGAPYKHGTIVLAKRTQDQQATLKQLWYDGGTPMLKPLNPRHPIMEMPVDTRIIGVAVKLELDL